MRRRATASRWMRPFSNSAEAVFDPLLTGEPDAEPWRAAVLRLLGGASPDTLVARSRDGLSLGPLFPPARATPQPWRDTASPVAVVARVDHPDAVEAAGLARADAEGGADVLTLAVEGAATARGFGLPVEALGVALQNVDLRHVRIRCEPPPFAGTATIAAVAELLAGRAVEFGIDPLGDMARTGRLPPGDIAQLAADTRQAATAAGVAGPVLGPDGRPHHEAGATDADELAALLATGVAYLRGLPAATGQASLAFTLVADADLLLTVAKFRALRRLWARVEAACGLPPRPIRLHGETAWRALARIDPWTNLLRITAACAGAILGGANSVATLPFTAALGLPDAFARRLARNTVLVLRDEAQLGHVADPAAGAGAFEATTDGLCRAAWAVFQDIEAAGGLAAALRDGRWQDRLATSRAARIAALRDGTARLVGVTDYALPNVERPTVLRPSREPRVGAAADFPPLPSVRDAEPFENDHPGPTRA